MDSAIYRTFIGSAIPINNDNIIAAAIANALNSALIQACMDVESAGKGFNADGTPIILFERHVFHRLTGGEFDNSNPEISSATPGGYGAGGFHQYERLLEAIECDRDSALRSASWGRFQLLGTNYKMVGYDTIEAMIIDFKNNEKAHLAAFIAFCKKTPCMIALKKNPPDFTGFAKSYNGSGSFGYDIKMEAAYRKFLANPIATGNPAPRVEPEAYTATLQLGSAGRSVAELQGRLGATGFMQTGLFQAETKAAVLAFQASSGLVADGVVGPRTMAALPPLLAG